MPRINLLPWRDEQRVQRRNQFYVALGCAFGGAAVLVLFGVLAMDSIIDSQYQRNALLKDEIKSLDSRITDILALEDQKSRLISRMQIIEQLQQSRPEIVHLFDEIVVALPDGVHFKEMKQTGTRIEIKGSAESNTRVSALMRNIDKSEWLSDPDLAVVEVKNTDGTAPRSSEFTVMAKQVTRAGEEEAK